MIGFHCKLFPTWSSLFTIGVHFNNRLSFGFDLVPAVGLVVGISGGGKVATTIIGPFQFLIYRASGWSERQWMRGPIVQFRAPRMERP